MRIDRTTFLALTAAIASVSAGACARQDARVPPRADDGATPRPLSIPKLSELDGGSSAVAERAAPPPVEAVCAENAVGSPAVCKAWKVDPTCEHAESLTSECMLLFYGNAGGPGGPDDGFQPRVAEKAAQCMTAKPVTRAKGCHGPDMHGCIREAVDTVCIDPAMTTACEKIVDACKGRRRKPTFTVEQCAKIATSTRGSMRDWALEAMSGLNANGAPSAEGCTLEYVTIYQPWPKNWWTRK